MKRLTVSAVAALLWAACSISAQDVAPPTNPPIVPPTPPSPSLAMASGTAKGTFKRRVEKKLLAFVRPKSRDTGATLVNLTSASVFVDNGDDRKPHILVISDVKLSTGGWTSENDIRKAPRFTGIMFWLGKDNKVFRTDQVWEGKRESTSGVFELKLDAQEEGSKDISGTAKTPSKDGKVLLDSTFHATL